MRPSLFALAAALFAAAPAYARPELPSGPPPLPNSAATIDEPEVSEEGAGRLTAHARKLRETKGCASALAAYRVIVGRAEGHEAAQHELGECLMEIDGASATETALFRQEGRFWLTRAAYAGNARAQRRLVLEMSAPANTLHDPKEALQWALVYEKNPTSALYGYKELPKTLVPGLKSSLSPEAVAEAESFATSFRPLYLQKFEAPKREQAKDGPRRPPPGVRPRRPGIGGAR